MKIVLDPNDARTASADLAVESARIIASGQVSKVLYRAEGRVATFSVNLIHGLPEWQLLVINEIPHSGVAGMHFSVVGAWSTARRTMRFYDAPVLAMTHGVCDLICNRFRSDYPTLDVDAALLFCGGHIRADMNVSQDTLRSRIQARVDSFKCLGASLPLDVDIAAAAMGNNSVGFVHDPPIELVELLDDIESHVLTFLSEIF